MPALVEKFRASLQDLSLSELHILAERCNKNAAGLAQEAKRLTAIFTAIGIRRRAEGARERQCLEELFLRTQNAT